MPAYTVAQLQTQLGSYVEPNGNFTDALSQVLPRIYAMGLWRDLVYEASVPATLGYISLPHDAEAVLACTVNDNPRAVRSLWHDVKIVGRQADVSQYFGIVDDGLRVMTTDLTDVQSVSKLEDVVSPADETIFAYRTGTGNVANTSDFEDATITITVRDIHGSRFDLENGASSSLNFEGGGYCEVLQIVYSDVPYAIDLKDANFLDKVIASIPAGSGVVRVRRFRVSDYGPDSVVHLLLKRACPTDLTADTVVHLGNTNAIKHALLARIAEDNADVERAEYHWSVVEKLLDSELDAFRGAAKPALTLNLWGNNTPYGLY